ncbi:nitrate reductase molybdenum cofactor assembly chaperone [Streptomyces tendae]|uniref:Nitrate reductase molybdenum cofactor assembly chaperone n=1 Tax=Streptomyces tendae TaxID=1932 RepID=A0A6B3QD75_STRTE|nr:nitrate reductase molybdenum cofactor assembly chaperone [Streptomyces tendae]NEV86216.1 nitrate reductase molybdenum cofactor assembly chaperone [Streptomyces tendae]
MSPLPTTVPAIVRTRVRAAVRRRAPRSPREAEERALVLRLLSLLSQYPDEELAAHRPGLASAVAALPRSPAAAELSAFMDWFTAQEPDALARHYVETFDLRRRSSLYLTYYLHGDTRRRGTALLTLARRYRAAGWDTDGGELPDHLPVVLEFAALAGPGAGEAPLRMHRRGLELIRHALTESGSPYRHLLSALLGLLPPATDADRAAVAKLAAEGPPEEEVGLGPYGAAHRADHGAGHGAGHGHPAYGDGEFDPPSAFVSPTAAPPARAPRTADGPRPEGRS